MDTGTPFRFVALNPNSAPWQEFSRFLCATQAGREAIAAFCLFLARRTGEDYRLTLMLPGMRQLANWHVNEQRERGHQLLIHAEVHEGAVPWIYPRFAQLKLYPLECWGTFIDESPHQPLIAGLVIHFDGERYELTVNS